MPETPAVIFKRRSLERSWTLDTFVASDGYKALRKALIEMNPQDVFQAVSDSALRGRGGAGALTGALKWRFIPKDSPKPKYVVCNGDEGEPGAFHDREIMEMDPHSLIEGMALAGYAIGSKLGFIYCRGEMLLARDRLAAAIDEARAAGFIGTNILDTGFDFDIVLHRGAGAYICGEETALLESLEGYRGMPRPRPPFPATEGLYGCPTAVNNVQTLCAVGPIVLNGAEWYRQWGTEKAPGTLVVSVSGSVNKPGNYEVPMGTPVWEILEIAGGTGPRGMKAFCPGGWSTPMLTPEHVNVGMDYESMAAAGTVLGASSIIVVPNDVCIVRMVLRGAHFYSHESCGKCTPCREGTYWQESILHRIEHGQGRMEDIDLLESVNDQMSGFKALCQLADFAAGPVGSSIKHFRHEYEDHVRLRGCPMNGSSAPSAPEPVSK